MESADKKRKIKKSVRIRLQKEEAKTHNKKDNIKASLRKFPTAPRKMRLVADMIRGESVNVALNLLKFDHKHASRILEKVLLSVIANWQQHNENVNIEDVDLYINKIYVDSGKMLKRLRTAPQGRAHKIRKRSHHVTIEIEDNSISNESNQIIEQK